MGKNYDPIKVFKLEKKLMILSDAFYQISVALLSFAEEADELQLSDNRMAIEMAKKYVEEYEKDHERTHNAET